MSREKREEILWDLHQENEVIVPLEFTEEIKPETFGLEVAKAKEMTSGLSTTLSERQVLIDAYNDVISLDITTENLPTFKELRLKIVKNRTQGIEKWHKTNKAFYLAGGRFVDAIKNKEVVINEDMEAKLLDAEKFFENQEKEKARLLNETRIERLKPYVEDTFGLDFSPMTDEDFDDYLLGKKTRFENEAKEREAELLRIENEKILDNLERERQLQIAPYLQFTNGSVELREMSDVDYQKLISDCQIAKNEFDKEQEKIRLDNERLQAELQAKKNAEIKVENERLAKIESDKKEAELLAKAPIKNQLQQWVASFELPKTDAYCDLELEIKEKFEAFKKWSINQINNL